MKPIVKKLPGPKSKKIIDRNKGTNLGWGKAYPFIQTSKGQGCYFEDLDGNVFLDFSSQIASNPLGYNHPDLIAILKQYAKNTPVKYAGQDFQPKEHQQLIDELLKTTPSVINSAFLINSGAEAVENAMKVAFYNKKRASFGISFDNAFHGRTLGALSATYSKSGHREAFRTFPFKKIPFNDTAADRINELINKHSAERIAFVLMEPIQGEGGYNVPSKKMVKEVRKVTRQNNIYLISDEVQAGMGRTGKMWAMEHFDVIPDIMTSAKALQVGATMSKKKLAPPPGYISSTWGGGHVIDLAMGIQTFKTIKKNNLLSNCTRMGNYLKRRLADIKTEHPHISNIRGLGLMVAFDLPNERMRNDTVTELLKNGLVTLGCSTKGIRLIPPYIVSKDEIDQAVDLIAKSVEICCKPKFKHKGEICNYLDCGSIIS